MTQSTVLIAKSYFRSSKMTTELITSSSVERFGQGKNPGKVTENIRVAIRITSTCISPLDQSSQKIPALGSGGRINQA
jgi:hypothetical protein